MSSAKGGGDKPCKGPSPTLTHLISFQVGLITMESRWANKFKLTCKHEHGRLLYGLENIIHAVIRSALRVRKPEESKHYCLTMMRTGIF